MSNFLAIATVTATLSHFLQNAVGQDVGNTLVTTQRPDINMGNGSSPSINIYAYQVTPNGALRNADLATRRSDGSLIQRPQVALDIHYLLSFYGDENLLEPQRMLGSAVRTLHAQPTLTRTLIQEALSDIKFGFLHASDLTEQIERVRLTPEALNLEELSKLWSVFFQVRYAISVAYVASVVLIESDLSPRSPLPVRDRNLYILPFRQPVIDRIESSISPQPPLDFLSRQPIVYASTLKIKGDHLQGEETLVRIGNSERTPTQVSSTELVIPLSAFPAHELRAGIQGVQVVHPILMGTPPIPHSAVESNVTPIVLRPTMTVEPPLPDLPVTRNNVTYLRGTLTLSHFVPPVGRRQRVVLLLNEFHPQSTTAARSYQFKAPAENGMRADDLGETTDQITFDYEVLAAGDYLVRVQVDGAESLLTFGEDPAQPNDPRYIEPRRAIA